MIGQKFIDVFEFQEILYVNIKFDLYGLQFEKPDHYPSEINIILSTHFSVFIFRMDLKM